MVTCICVGVACSRRSDSGGGCEEKRSAKKKKNEGGGEVREGTTPLSPVPLYFLSLSLLRTALHYLNAWNRLCWGGGGGEGDVGNS